MVTQKASDYQRKDGSPWLDVSINQSASPALNVELQCEPGEMLALVGPSGSGKSTILRTIAGLHKTESGHVRCGPDTWLDTSNAVNVAVQKRRVGMVFQHYALFPHKSVIDNVSLAIRNKSKADTLRMAKSWLERTNMTGLENRLPKQLSGGQRQRVALARALAGNPSLLLLDEPFSAVDQQTRRKLYRELAKLRSGLDIPMILVTHDVNEVQQLADSLCLIHRGQSLQQGPVRDVINAPLNKSIAKLLGHQNLFPAVITQKNSESTVFSINEKNHLIGAATDLAEGSSVTLLISPSAISITSNTDHTPDVPSNQLSGNIRDAVSMGDEWSITLHLDTVTKSLRFRTAQHNCNPALLQAGCPITVYVRPSGIVPISN